MSNLEDKYLGYFRILEALTYRRKEILDGDRLKEIAEKAKPYLYKKFEADGKKNVNMFVRGITRCNKYNTEKCIQDLLLRIPNREKLKNGNFKKRILVLYVNLEMT